MKSTTMHPTGNDTQLSFETANAYNMYISSGNLRGNYATAYTSMVP